MSNATQRNMAAVARERDRRLGAMLDGSAPIGQLAVTGEPGWDAFFGSLHDKADAANAAGMRFSGDISGIGRLPSGADGGGLQYPSDVGAAQKNAALGAMADENARRQLGLSAAVDAQRQSAIDAMRQSETDQRNAGILAPPITDRVVQDAHGVYSTQPASTDPRQQMLDKLPLTARTQVEKELAAIDTQKAAQAETARHNQATEALTSAGMLTDDAVEQTAKRYLETGVMPPLGMGDKTTRQRVLNKAAELDPTGNIASNSASFRSDQGSLATLQKQRDAVGAFEGTALKNLDNFLDLAKKVPDTGSPVFNTPLRALGSKGLGSTDLAAYNAARTVVVPEFAKILSSPTAAGQLSDSARHEVENVISGNATLAQTLAVANLLKKDAENRRQSYDEQISKVRERIGANSKPAAPSSGKTQQIGKYSVEINR